MMLRFVAEVVGKCLFGGGVKLRRILDILKRPPVNANNGSLTLRNSTFPVDVGDTVLFTVSHSRYHPIMPDCHSRRS